MSQEEGDAVGDQLLLACQNGDAHTLQTLMSSVAGLDLAMTTEDGVTLIMHTIIGAGTGANPDGMYVETVQLLLQVSAQPLDTVDTQYGRTAAHWAVFYKRHDLLAQLIYAGAEMTTPDFNGTSPFHLAIDETAILCMQEIIRLWPREILEYPDTDGHTPLERAIQFGNVEACQVLVTAGASVNTMDQDTGQSPLHLAAQNGSIPITELLLQNDAILDLNDASGMTPIHIASIVGSRELLGVMVKLAGDAVLSLPDSRGVTPLMYACAYGNENLAKYLLKKKANVLDCDMNGKTALHWAAECPQEGGCACVQLLVKKNRDLLESKDGSGRTPILCAAMSGQADSLNALLNAGADIGVVDNDNHTAGHWATVSGQPQVLVAVLTAGGTISTPDSQGAYPIHYAVQECREPEGEEFTDEAQQHSVNMQECLKLILEQGGDVGCRDAQGMTPLHWGLQFPNNLVACSLLLSNGADPKAKEHDGLTGLHVAARQGLTENCRFLLEHTGGSVANELDNQGQSALFAAVESGQLECVEYLLQINLSPNVTNVEGRSPVHVASTMGFTACLQLLQAYRADLTTRSIHGATSMHEAAANGHTESLEYLLKCGCPPDDPAGPSGATALHYAVTEAHGECVHALLQYGANVNAVAISEEEKLTPLDYCTDYHEMTEYLRKHGALLGVEMYPPQEEVAADDLKVAESEAEGQSADGAEPVTESVDVALDKSETREPGELEPSKHEAGTADGREEEGVVVAQTSRPATPDRRNITWEEAGGGAMTREGEGEGEKMRRPSQQSLDRVGVGALKQSAPRLLERALSVLRGSRSPPPPGSILSSAVGFYAAHTTILAATIIGSSVGSKVTKVAEKVATDTAEDLKKAAGTFEGDIPDLVWLREPPPAPTPPPLIELHPPTPSPSPTPSLQITFEPLERRMRKAKAQMDMTKSPGYRAVEELLKAQTTHMTLRKQFEGARVSEMTLAQREAFAAEEVKEKEAADAILRRLNGRIKRADSESEQVHEALDQQLRAAREENEKIRQLMGKMGVNPRPTVAQWLEQKKQQKKKAMQEALISWDRSKPRRETAILVQQMLTSQRAMKHAAWGASKDISAKIRAMKREELLGPAHLPNSKPLTISSSRQFPRPPTYPKIEMAADKSIGKLQGPPIKRSRRKPSVKPNKTLTSKSPLTVNSSVRATPQGFRKIREHDVATGTLSPRQQQSTPSETISEEMWQMGHSYAQGRFNPTKLPRTATPTYLRATGPKSAHATRTLHFLPPQQYRAEKQEQKRQRMMLMKEYMEENGLEEVVPQPPAKSFLAMQSLEFSGKGVGRREGERGRRASFGNTTAQYHSLADNIGGRGQFPRKPRKRASSVEIPVLPMTVLNPPLNTPSPVNC